MLDEPPSPASRESSLLPSRRGHVDDRGRSRGEFPEEAHLGQVAVLVRLGEEGGARDSATDLTTETAEAPLGYRARDSLRPAGPRRAYRFSRDMLKDVMVINQVDHNFIACVVATQVNGRHLLSYRGG